MRALPILLCVVLSACSQERGETPEPALVADGPGAGADHPVPLKTPVADHAPAKAPAGPNYEISTTPQGPFKVGGEGRVDVRLVGRNGYHVNKEYPIELALKAPQGARLAKATLGPADATAFEEAQALFAVAVTPETAGPKALHGTLNFSVCNPQNCLLERQDVTVAIDAAP